MMAWGRGGLRNVLSVVDTTATKKGLGFGGIDDELPTTVLEILKERAEAELAEAAQRPLTLDQMAADIQARQRRIASIEAAITHEQAALKQELEELATIQAEFSERVSPLVQEHTNTVRA